MFIPTDQHRNIHAALFSSSSNLIIEACAGSGKTSTATWLAGQIPRRKDGQFLDQAITFLAFNKSIAEALKTRLPSYVAASTFHSLGFSALKTVLGRSVKVDAKKCMSIVYSLMDREDPDIQNVQRLVSLCKNQWPMELDTRFVQSVAEKQDLELLDDKSYVAVLRTLERSWKDQKTIDFDDMLLLPLLLDAEFTKQDYVFVDECQDTNDIQLEILGRLGKRERCDTCDDDDSCDPPCCDCNDRGFTWKTKFVFVGDPHQAIYAFRGANADSMDRIKDRFGCLVLPLDVSYRCPQSVVAEAQKQLQSPTYKL